MEVQTHVSIKKSLDELSLNFALRTVGEWRGFLDQTTKATWNQTFQYAAAVSKVAYQSTRFATIERSGQIVGIVSIQEAKLGPIHLVHVYRGPLWFRGQETAENFKEFVNLFNKTFPKRFLRRIRWMPEWSFTDDQTVSFIEETGFKKVNQSFETLWIDLSPSLEEIKKTFDRKWRNHLHKAERSNLEVIVDTHGKHLDVFLRAYDAFKFRRNFEGPDGKFMKHEIEKALPFKDAIIMWARINGIPVAGIVVMRHGTTASYRIAWNTDDGRKENAHFLLLWKAIEILKKHNVEMFDLGGILPDDNCGLNTFKLGMKGIRFKTEVLK